MIKAVIFDLDGVLVDSLEAWFRLFNKALRHFGKEEITLHTFKSRIWGGNIEGDAKEFFGRPVEDIKKIYFDGFDEFKKGVRLFPDTKNVLTKLKNKGLKVGLATNTPCKQAHKLLDYLSLKDDFDVILGGDEVEHGKPAPDIIILACKRLGIKIKESAYVGDSNADMAAGRKAGCLTIGFRIDGDKRIEDLGELLEMQDFR
ncbi:HAD family phosphatase [Candidatus Woesearchaeota archaeon]|nr:HAD family phosphatase [Candidatus Woesearchaeota archaeon]